MRCAPLSLGRRPLRMTGGSKRGVQLTAHVIFSAQKAKRGAQIDTFCFVIEPDLFASCCTHRCCVQTRLAAQNIHPPLSMSTKRSCSMQPIRTHTDIIAVLAQVRTGIQFLLVFKLGLKQRKANFCAKQNIGNSK